MCEWPPGVSGHHGSQQWIGRAGGGFPGKIRAGEHAGGDR